MRLKNIILKDKLSIELYLIGYKNASSSSDTSDKLLNYINDNSCEIACTTVYRKGKINLPNNNVIDLYKSKAKNFYCAGDKSKDLKAEYGSILMKCDIFKERN